MHEPREGDCEGKMTMIKQRFCSESDLLIPSIFKALSPGGQYVGEFGPVLLQVKM